MRHVLSRGTEKVFLLSNAQDTGDDNDRKGRVV